MQATTAAKSWHAIVQATLKANDVKLITYVPDKVLTPLIKGLHADAISPPSPPRARKKPSASSPAHGWADAAARC